MFNTDGVIYVLKRKIRDRDHWTRIANTREEFERYGGTLDEQPTVEKFPNSRRSMLELIASCLRRRPDDPLIAVSTWEELRNLKVAQALIRGNFTVVVADKARKSRLANTENSNDAHLNILLGHALEVNRNLREYVDGTKTGRFSAVNEQRAGAANAFALNIWPAIKNAAEKSETTNQSEIAAILGSQGLKSIMGSPIRQAQISSYIRKAGRKADWDELLQRFPKK